MKITLSFLPAFHSKALASEPGKVYGQVNLPGQGQHTSQVQIPARNKNAYLQNVPTISIREITGYGTEKGFLKYIKISQEQNANKLVNHPFFM